MSLTTIQLARRGRSTPTQTETVSWSPLPTSKAARASPRSGTRSTPIGRRQGALTRALSEHSIHVELLRDPASRRAGRTGLQKRPAAERAAARLEAETECVGYAPLVLSTDNGSA
jgi:hypothetical protein